MPAQLLPSLLYKRQMDGPSPGVDSSSTKPNSGDGSALGATKYIGIIIACVFILAVALSMWWFLRRRPQRALPPSQDRPVDVTLPTADHDEEDVEQWGDDKRKFSSQQHLALDPINVAKPDPVAIPPLSRSKEDAARWS
ncbi:hypothetical protein CYLTODRAFT_417593 [Cylindrobasidium torrendii FP15055 ss-10]|uniref:Uncharacterized protein n=1 Tax=Cylindrobasidium torrendii FP15055 ss-10 TaxID=1314674 RepID=A0A0D7BT89_9AGAR|nr:hypothetical protein CYLTODRAFT_417593 [Cylindrobasidium torrendii FP15055 ss-10]